MRPRSTSCCARKTCRSTTAPSAASPILRALEPAAGARQHRQAVAVFTPFMASTTDYGRACARDSARAVLARYRADAAGHTALAEAGRRPIRRPLRRPPKLACRGSGGSVRPALDRPTALNEVDFKALLRDYGIATPHERLVRPRRKPSVLRTTSVFQSCSRGCRPRCRTRATPDW